MTIEVYEPNSVRLPVESPLARGVPPHRVHIDPHRPLSLEELESFDRKTVLFDLFKPHGRRRLTGIGPPLGDLAVKVLPLAIRFHDTTGNWSEPLIGRIDRFDTFDTYEFAIPTSYRHGDELPVRLELADGSTFDLYPKLARRPQVFLTLSTIQKDEPPTWLRQWASYWHALGVDRLVIYDNGSERFDEVVTHLERVPESLDVIVVRWNFEYGPTRSFDLASAQPGSLNHARMAFGASAWQAAFDVDEYPIVQADEDLRSFLRGQRPWVGQVLVRGYNVWNTQLDLARGAPLPTARDFTVRDRDASHTTKYFVRPSRARRLDVHHADTRPFRKARPEPDRISYFHFLPLNRGWKHPDRVAKVAFEPARHTIDNAMVKALDRFGIQ